MFFYLRELRLIELGKIYLDTTQWASQSQLVFQREAGFTTFHVGAELIQWLLRSFQKPGPNPRRATNFRYIPAGGFYILNNRRVPKHPDQ